MPSLSFLTEEEQAAFENAVKVLTPRHRLMLTLVPEQASEELCKRVTTWIDFILDTGLLPPLVVPAIKHGDGLRCPYCQAPVNPEFPKTLAIHDKDCKWLQAVNRWAVGNLQIDKEHGRE